MPRRRAWKTRKTNKKNSLSRRFARKGRRPKGGRRRRRSKQSTLPLNSRSLPAGYARQSTSYFFTRHASNGILVFGSDLVYGIPNAVVVNGEETLFSMITANPCYWQGTRVATVASAYQNYRPLKMRFRYVPQVAVTTPGIVVCGTIWNTPTSSSSLQQTLVTSNGGRMCQCYVPFYTQVKLGSNLQQNLFQCAGNLDVDHNPFNFAAIMRGTNVVPGYFFVEYAFEFKNPLGMAVEYTAQRTNYPDTGVPKANKSLITLAGLAGLSGPGLVVDIEADGDALYNGTSIYIPPGTPVMVYANEPLVGGHNVSSSIATFTWASPTKDMSLTGLTLDEAAGRADAHGYAIYNASDDSNTQTKDFDHGGSFQYGLARHDSDDTVYLEQWMDGADALGTIFQTYTYDPALKQIGQLLQTFKGINSSRTSPATIIPIIRAASQVLGNLNRPKTFVLDSKAKTAVRPKKSGRVMVVSESD